MKKEELIKLLRKTYLSGVMEKELADKMIGFNHDLEGMATNYAEIEVNNIGLGDVSNCCVNCDEAIINEPYCESCYDLANSRDNT